MFIRKILSTSVPALQKKQCVRTIFWWGHDTIEDQEARIKAAEDKKIIKWDKNPDELTTTTKKSFYAPARIAAEENAMPQVKDFFYSVLAKYTVCMLKQPKVTILIIYFRYLF